MQTPATPADQPLPPDADSPVESQPDSSWSLDRLGQFATEEVNNSLFAQEAAIFQASKSAVYLFRAGHALFIAREKCKGEKHGDWTKFKRKYTLADTSVNDAIRLYENAKTEDALAGLGITEAKKKFVYPLKQAITGTANPVKKPGKKTAKSSPLQRANAAKHAGDQFKSHEPAEASESNGDTATESASAPPPKEPDTVLGRLVKLVRLLEYARDEMKAIDWTKETPDRFRDVVSDGIQAFNEINGGIPDAGA